MAWEWALGKVFEGLPGSARKWLIERELKRLQREESKEMQDQG